MPSEESPVPVPPTSPEQHVSRIEIRAGVTVLQECWKVSALQVPVEKPYMHPIHKEPRERNYGNAVHPIPERLDEENSNKAPSKKAGENSPKNRNNNGKKFSGHVPTPSFL